MTTILLTLLSLTAFAKGPDVVFVPTPEPVVARMLDLAEVKRGDVVYDLGSGDGRIVEAAARRGARAVGFEIRPELVRQARERLKEAGLEKLATIREADLFAQDLRPASVITLYLLPSLNVKLLPQLEKLKPGTRIVSHDFDIEGIEPRKVEKVALPEGGTKTVYYFTTPLRPVRRQAR
jgi:SAM-dependent methyltransferase